MTNDELTNQLALEMALDLHNRRPTAKEVFKHLDIELLPHATVDTTLCEIYDWFKRNWRTTNDTFIPWLYPDPTDTKKMMEKLANVERVTAEVPNFEFDKENLLELGVKIPQLFGIKVVGDVKNAKKFSIKISEITKSRLSNSVSPGMEIARRLSEFKMSNPRDYRKNIKFDYIAEALFYAEKVEVELEKEAGVSLDIGFEMEGIEVETEMNTETKKKMKLTYSNKIVPFGASLVKGKNLF